MRDITESKLARLRELHSTIISSAVKTIQAAVEAGGILTEIKADLPHGEFTAWCGVNLPFDVRTAQRYMHCYAHRDRLLKNDTLSLLTDAYKLLVEPQTTLEKIEKACAILEEVKSRVPYLTDPDELQQVLALAIECENHAREIKFLAARRIGELCPAEKPEKADAKGGRGKKGPEVREAFPESQRLSEFRKLAEIPLPEFRRRDTK